MIRIHFIIMIFFGGDLEGIRQKLDYLQGLGVTVLYLNPIFSAGSNHKYDPADYDHIDPMFGTEEDFQKLAQEAAQRGIYLVLDGVFNHVGDDSIYFDRYGKYEWVGAYEYWARVYDKMNTELLRKEDARLLVEEELVAEGQKLSPYAWQKWFVINNAQVDNHYAYEGWAGYDSLPAILEPGPQAVENPRVNRESELNNPEWAEYILFDENSVAKRWIKLGASGWRMDVADEVDAAVWKAFRKELKQMTLPGGESPLFLGEIWFDASHFFLGDEFDSVMNYAFRHAVMNLLLVNGDAAAADEVFQSLRQNYPKEAVYALMNLMGSHDTPRAIYLLGGGKDTRVVSEKGKHFDYELGKNRMKLAAIFQMGFPGAATIYYGDEAGQFGSRDPDCRRTYPWGNEDTELLEHYRRVAKVRTVNRNLFAHGDLFTLYAKGDVYVYGRSLGEQLAIIAINRGNGEQTLSLDLQGKIPEGVTALRDQIDTLYSTVFAGTILTVNIPPMSGRMLLSQ